MKLQVRPSVLNSLAPQLSQQLPRRPFVLQTCAYATQQSSSSSSAPKRRSVTPFNDDGQVPWSELSVGGKAARATQQSFNFGLVIVGIALTVSRARAKRRVLLYTCPLRTITYNRNILSVWFT
jgi:mitochondrial import inner membrane translocase subunit TIM21